jgi:putative MATE family efflux protein
MQKLIAEHLTARKFYKFVTPSIIMLLFISLYSIVDGIFVANFVGSDALAAINIIFPIAGLAMGTAIMLASGSSAIVAILLGEKKQREADEKFTLICLVALIVGIVFATLGYVFIDEVIRLLGATDRLYEYCRIYGTYMIISAPFLFVGMIYEYYIRVDGKPGFTLVLYVSGGVTNIVLDYVFIVRMGLGIEGAALATLIGIFVTFVLGAWYFSFGKSTLRYKKPQFDWGYIRSSLINGSSQMVSELSTGITTLIFNLAVLRLAGEDGVAALTIILYAQFLMVSTYMGFSMGVSPLISYGYGAERHDQILRILRFSKIFIIISSLAVFLIAELGASTIIRVFVGLDSPVYGLALQGLRIFDVAFLFIGINVFISGMFTAYANGKISSIISFSRSLFFIAAGVIVLPWVFGLPGIWLTVPFAELMTLGISYYFFKKYRSKYQY